MGNGVIGRTTSGRTKVKVNGDTAKKIFLDEPRTITSSDEYGTPKASGPPQALVMCGPSGAGKSTIYHRIALESLDTIFRLALQDTTRPARPGEVDGKDYNFLKLEEFARNEASRYYEWLGVLERSDGTKYGFHKSELRQANCDGIQKSVVSIFDIDVERALAMRSTGSGLVDCALLMILPPSEKSLRERLKNRADLTMTEDFLKQRLDYSKQQMLHGFENFSCWDLIMVNDDLERTYAAFRNFIMRRFCIKEVRK